MRRFVHHAVILAVFALFGVSAIAAAQRGRRGDSRADNPQGAGTMMGGPPPIPPTVAALVLEHADDFKLADSQRVVLESVRRAQDSANMPWRMKLDSLRPTRQPANGMGDLSQEQRDELEARRTAIAMVLDGMKENNAQARKKVMDVLDPDQQKRAASLEEDARKKAADDAKQHERSGPPAGGRGGRGRPPEG
jgi:hypothetical protein